MKGSPLTLFSLASGRSGTRYLADFFHKNVLDCHSTHEPYLTLGNPVLFGAPIDWNSMEDDARLLPVLERKCRFIQTVKQAVYLESSHAFLKAFNRHAGNMLPDPGFIHLVRNPKYVAKSEWLREQAIRSLPIPWTDYRSDNGERLFRWSLTGKEGIFQHFRHRHISRLQFYLLQWIEIEYRAMQLIDQNQWQNRVFFIDVDTQLDNDLALKNMLDFFDLRHLKVFNKKLQHNRTPFVGPTVITPEDEAEFADIMHGLPETYRQIFHRPPYKAIQSVSALFYHENHTISSAKT